MNKKDLRIVFLGTPEFALPSLELLVGEGWNIVAVVTAPDKPKGRGLQVAVSPIKKFALEKKLSVLQPLNLKDKAFLHELESYKADLQIVVAFRMLPEVVWDMPPMGTMNLHASLLPNYRGAAPINWVLINGEKETGATTFMLKHEIDTGDILLQDKIEIHEDDNAGTLHDRLKLIGAELVIKSVEVLCKGDILPLSQKIIGNEKLAPKISKEVCQIDWNKGAVEVKNLIRGLSPYPAAQTIFNGQKYKIFKAEVVEESEFGKPGEIRVDNNSQLLVQTGKGVITLMEIQKEGRNKMNVKDFLIGNSI